ncbi:MAG: hypothetical protein FWB75_07335 [Oscillospiraceae bacterium]|nr:hypothetical protein [Oscillospiraceae bacterium]
METLKSEMKAIQGIIFEAYKTSGNLMALLENSETSSAAIADALDKMAGQFESNVVMLRNLCERHHPGPAPFGSKPPLPHISISGKVEVNMYGWLHIKINTLLPHCRFRTPQYLRDTITRLLDKYEAAGRTLPRFDNAMLIIDEHCDINTRAVYDQDNKGWKAIPNALKGRVISDDDQFSLGISLVSTRTKDTACNIYLLPRHDAADFFSLVYDC